MAFFSSNSEQSPRTFFKLMARKLGDSFIKKMKIYFKDRSPYKKTSESEIA